VENRKLATILSLDVVGYSAAAEKDDAAAAKGVRSLRAAINEIVAPFGGRIFSSAGDGFMLEFPVATAGVQAAMALLEACKSPTLPLPQIRVGMHLGEVIVEDNGDLLGHGVNIAARLQQRAHPGAMIVSEEVRRSVRGGPIELLRPLGTIKLDKMSEQIAIHGFGSGPIVRRRWRSDRRLALIGSGVIALAVVATLAIVTSQQPSSGARTAVFAFVTPSSDEPAKALADGIANEIGDTMSEIGLEPISRSETNAPTEGSRIERAEALRAVYALDGDIVREGQIVRVSVRLDDVTAHRTVWAQTFERDDAHMGALRLEVAAAAVSVLRCASEARGEQALRGVSIANLLRICEVSIESGSAERMRLARQFAQAAPRSSIALGRLALESANASQSVPASMQDQLKREAMNAADAALRLNPHNGTAAAVKAYVLSFHQTRVEQERTLLDFLTRAPDGAELNALYASFLREAGRNEEAVAYLERAYALEPLSPFRAGTLGWGLAIVGRQDEAKALLARTAARWPEDEGIIWDHFRTSLWTGTRSETLRILADNGWDRVTKACWRNAIDGMAATSAAARRSAASDVSRCLHDNPYQRFEVLAALGDLDGAFEIAELMVAEQSNRGFFVPGARAFRRDPRFMPLMQRADLVEYWLQSNHWPDFCAEPQLPYNCRAEAVRLSVGR
jgi:class 3 adenylate cyclase/TolB-like protein